METTLVETTPMETVPLYHGTDSRILAMSPEERRIFREDCLLATRFLWTLFKPYYYGRCEVPLNEPGLEGKTKLEPKLIELKEPLQYDLNNTRYVNLKSALDRIDAQMRGCEQYQYDNFYLTNHLDTAIDYAKSAFAFGEVGLNAYRLLDAAAMIKFSKWEPDQKTAQAIEKIKRFGKAEPCPIVLVFTVYDLENLRMEDGSDLLFPLEPDSRSFYTFRYLGDLDVASADQWNLEKAQQKAREFDMDGLTMQ